MFSLKLAKRALVGKKVKNERLSGSLPVSMYGPGIEPQTLSGNLKEIDKIVHEAGYNNIIEVEVDGKKENALVREIQYDPVSAALLHVSLYRVDMNKKVNVTIPFVITGLSMAVKNNIGFMVNPIDQLPIRATPKNIPESLTIDISHLDNIGDSVLIKDLKLPEGVELQPKVNPILAIVTIVPPQKEIVEEVKVVAAATTEGATAEGATPVEGATPAEATPGSGDAKGEVKKMEKK